jgi:hypothetical protein
MKKFHRPARTLTYYILLAVTYTLLSAFLPVNHETATLYHLSAVQYHILLLIVTLPVLVIWCVAFYGYSQVKRYASVIHETREGPAFTFIADGLMWLAWGLPIPAIISAVMNALGDTYHGFYGTSVIITNYANMLVPLVALHILSSGSRTLLEKSNLRLSIISTKFLTLLFVLIGTVYCYFLFREPAASLSADYYLPPWLIIGTLVVPYLYAWFVGLLGAYEISLVSRHAGGVLYRRALQLLSRGLTVIIVASITLQFLHSLLSHNASSHLSLGYMLIIIYLLLFVMGLGYSLVAYGVRRLRRIEEA